MKKILFFGYMLFFMLSISEDLNIANLTVTDKIQNGSYVNNIIEFRATEWKNNAIKIVTNMPFVACSGMPALYIEGYDYASGRTINVSLSWYCFYSPTTFINMAASSYGSCLPVIKLCDEYGKVAIILEKPANEDWYYSRFIIRGTESLGSDSTWYKNWSILQGKENAGATVAKFNVSNRFEYVGIGKDYPRTNLDIAGRMLINSDKNVDTVNIRAASDGQYFRILDGNSGIGLTDKDWTNTLILSNNKDFNQIFSNDGKPIIFQLLDGGNVGIGIKTPQAKLEVNGKIVAYDDLRVYKDAIYKVGDNLINNNEFKTKSGMSHLVLGNGDYHDTGVYVGGGSAHLFFGKVSDNGTKTEFARFTDSGNVGIGTEIVNSLLTLKKNNWISADGNDGFLGLIGGNPGDSGAGIVINSSNSERGSLEFFMGNNSNAEIGFRKAVTGQLVSKIDFNGNFITSGNIKAKELVVTATPWADFVFEPDYKLKTLPEVEAYIAANKHLPDMPSEAEVKEKGANIGDVQAKLLQKIEELTLYVIEQNKNTEMLRTENSLLRESLYLLKKEVDNLHAQIKVNN